MSLATIFRWLPTPGYGKCGGAKRDCSTSDPRNWMDKAFEQHDKALSEATTIKMKRTADNTLYQILKLGNIKELSFYGKLYRIAALVVFKD